MKLKIIDDPLRLQGFLNGRTDTTNMTEQLSTYLALPVLDTFLMPTSETETL